MKELRIRNKVGERINWHLAGYALRIAVLELCGWRNKTGNATPTGKALANKEWSGLSPAARRVLIQHGITE